MEWQQVDISESDINGRFLDYCAKYERVVLLAPCGSKNTAVLQTLAVAIVNQTPKTKITVISATAGQTLSFADNVRTQISKDGNLDMTKVHVSTVSILTNGSVIRCASSNSAKSNESKSSDMIDRFQKTYGNPDVFIIEDPHAVYREVLDFFSGCGRVYAIDTSKDSENTNVWRILCDDDATQFIFDDHALI